MDKINHSLNKSLKATKEFRSVPSYSFNRNSRLCIELPNGMDLVLYSNKTGEFCHVDVSNHQRTEDYKIKSNLEKKELDSKTTIEDNEFRYIDNNVSFGFEFTKFNNK